MIRTLLVAFILGLSLSPSVEAQWSRLTIDDLYEHFYYSYPTGLVDDVINLNPTTSPPPTTQFRLQSLANPHILVPDDLNGDWLISAYGTRLIPPGDSIYMLRRRALHGDYDIPAAPVLAGSTIGVGAGAAMVKAPATTVTGRRYFALVPVLKGTQGWITWASRDTNGTSWSFLGANGLPVSDPALSVKLIRRADNGNRWHHPAIVHAKILGIDHFFVSLGYGGGCGITAASFRLTFDPLNPNGFGLKFDAGLNSYLVERWSNTTFVATNGQVANDDSWQCAATNPKDVSGAGNSPADPMDLISLTKPDGTFDSILFVYSTAKGYGWSPTRIAYSKAGLPTTATANLQWGPLHVLDTSSLWDRATYPSPAYEHTYNSCGSGGGNFMALTQGAPPGTAGTLYGYISAYRDDLYTSVDPGCYWNCGNQPQGLLPLSVKQQSLGLDAISPRSGPRTGGYSISVAGEGFTAPATVRLGGTLATNITLGGTTTLTGTAPAHAAGVANLKVTIPNGTSDVISDAFVFDFDDVAAAHPYHDSVVTLARNQITAGCTVNTYCPDNTVTRGQMATFLLKSRYGFRYPPPPPETPRYFTDVPASDPAAPWIDAIYRMAITAGCAGTGTCSSPNGTTQYCPTSPVLRQQMAVFLLKTLHYSGNPWSPPACATAGFTLPDVPCPSPPFGDWIYEAVRQGHMTTCGTGPLVCSAPCAPGAFCPAANVLRKDMALHLIDTFGLQ